MLVDDYNIDCLLVNSTNEFLEEYTDLSENARYKLTRFSGSTGDALLTRDKIFLFVDGRYHTQADIEVDHSKVDVVKLKVNETFTEKLFEKLPENSVLGIVSTKISQNRLEIFQKFFKEKNITIKLLDKDPILPVSKLLSKDNTEYVGDYGLSTEEKIKLVTKNLNDDDAIFTSNQEEISYILNRRDFSKNYSSSVKKQKKLITKKGIYDLDYEISGKVYLDKVTTSAYDWKRFGDKAAVLDTNPIKLLKSIKTDEEIEHYKTCFEKTDKAIIETRNFIEKYDNLSEFDISEKLEENFHKYGAKSLSFKSIVAKDKNSALAHYSKCSKDEKLQNGSLVLIDCGAYYEDGLATDCTRVFVKGTPSKLQKQIYTLVLKAFLNGLSYSVKKDITMGYDIDNCARVILKNTAPSGFEFSHSLGHGIGIGVHENPPSLSPSEIGKTVLKPNMCFTIEPGLYNPEYFGVRIENSCFLDKDYKINSFSKLGFEEKLIDYSLLTDSEKSYIYKVL